ncbi:MAG: PilZ domain-containing protein [Pseudomonadales bacterium]|nr:PilZ domain-containing protein [Pseudomonadales bacterium]
MDAKFSLTNEPSSSTHRHKSREVLYYNLRVFDIDTNKVAGYINDISVDGVKLLTALPVCKGEVRRFRIDLPRRSSEDGHFRAFRSIIFDAVSAWASDDDRASFYECGFQFVNLDAATRVLISELISDCHR